MPNARANPKYGRDTVTDSLLVSKQVVLSTDCPSFPRFCDGKAVSGVSAVGSVPLASRSLLPLLVTVSSVSFRDRRLPGSVVSRWVSHAIGLNPARGPHARTQSDKSESNPEKELLRG
jgi:hypothetical protein